MSSHRASGEPDLRHWLANEDWYPSQFTRDFFERTPPVQANDELARIAEDADLEKLTPWSLFTIGFALAGFTMSFGLAGPSINDRKAGIRAALYLAERGDVRAVPALARVWSKGGLLASRYQEQIDRALTQFLQNTPPSTTEAYRDALDALAQRVWTARGRRDLTEADAGLLLALLPHLSADGPVQLTSFPGQTGHNRAPVSAAVARLLSPD